MQRAAIAPPVAQEQAGGVRVQQAHECGQQPVMLRRVRGHGLVIIQRQVLPNVVVVQQADNIQQLRAALQHRPDLVEGRGGEQFPVGGEGLQQQHPLRLGQGQRDPDAVPEAGGGSLPSLGGQLHG